MCPLTFADKLVFHPKVKLRGWRNEEERIYLFGSNGFDFKHKEHGLAYVYDVRRYDEEKDEYGELKQIWVRPNGAIAISILDQLNDVSKGIKDRVFRITHIVGSKNEDTRYNFVELRTDTLEPKDKPDVI